MKNLTESRTRWLKLKQFFFEALGRDSDPGSHLLERRPERDKKLHPAIKQILAARKTNLGFMKRPLFHLLGLGRESARINQKTGAYRILRRLGSGGMGTVYLARREDGEFDHHVAIKVLKKGMDTEEIVLRFKHERQILAHLNHPYIGKLLDGGTTLDGLPYFVLEYVEGLPLDEYCDRQKLSLKQRLDIFCKICSAVQFAHSNFVVHRDLKPNNILVTTEGVPKLLDFGLAKLLSVSPSEPGLTAATGHRFVTPDYASPEVVLGKAQVTTSADVYSLGVILYQLLTGLLPRHVTLSEALEKGSASWEKAPELPSLAIGRIATPRKKSHKNNRHNTLELSRKLSGDLDQIVLMALRPEPRRRYQTVQEISDDIHRHMRGFPVIAQQPTLAYWTSKFVRRNRLAVASASLFLVTLTSFTVLLLLQQRSLEVQRDRAVLTSNFLTGLFRMADPFENSERTTNWEEVLDRGREQLVGLAEVPEVRASLALTIGQGYLNLGAYDLAQQLFMESVDLRRRTLGPHHTETGTSLQLWGLANYYKGDFDAAEQAYRQAMSIHQQELGQDHPSVAEDMSVLALLLKDKGDYEGAEPLYRRALEIRRVHYGLLHRHYANAANNLATLLVNLGDYQTAESLYKEALEGWTHSRGEDYPEIVLGLSHLGRIYRKLGRYQEAEDHYRRAVDLARRTLGDDHPYTIRTLNSLGLCLKETGAYGAARGILSEVVSAFRKKFGNQHTHLAGSLNNYALVLHQLGLYEESLKSFEEALGIYRQELGDKHPNTAKVLASMASLLNEMGETGEAEKLARTSLRVKKEALGEKHLSVAVGSNLLGQILLRQRKLSQAKLHFAKAQAILRDLGLGDHYRSADSLTGLGRVLAIQGDLIGAEELLSRARELYALSLPRDHPKLAAVLVDLASTLFGQGSQEEAGVLLREALTIFEQQLPPEHWQIKKAKELLAKSSERRSF